MVFLLGVLSRNWLYISSFVLVMISILSLSPLPNLPSVPGGDKLHHIVAYFVLMFPVALRQPRYWRLTMIFFITWGGCIELLQPYVNRYAEWLDFLANSIGVLLGMVGAIVLRFCFPLLTKK